MDVNSLCLVLNLLLNILARNADIRYTLGPEVLVNSGFDGGSLQCEPSVAVYGNIVVTAWNDSFGGKQGAKTGVVIGWAISYDRGNSFQFGGYLPKAITDENDSGADSWLMTDGDGNFYLQLLNWQNKNHKIELYYMDKSRPGQWEKTKDASNARFVDKPCLFVNDSGKIFIVYTGISNSIFFVSSHDKGFSWTRPTRISSKTNRSKSGASIAAVKDKVVACWFETNKKIDDEVWGTYSLDGGKTFKPAEKIYILEKTIPVPNGYALGYGQAGYIANNTWLSISTKQGDEAFFLTFCEGTARGSRVLLLSREYEKNNWSSPITIGKSPATVIKVFPAMAAFDQYQAILYYDRRNHPGTSLTDVYLSIVKGAQTIQDIKINSVSTDWKKTQGDREYAPIQRNFGDYISITSFRNSLFAVWTDGRSGKPRIYFRRIDFF